MDQGTVAVVVRTKDRPVLLARALDDIGAQTLVAARRDAVSVVVVNDGGDAARVAALVAGHPLADRITVLDNASSRGRWPAANQGVAGVASDYVVLHDDDDTWKPGFLAATTAFLDAPENADYAGVVTFSEVVHEVQRGETYVETAREPFAREITHISFLELCRRNQFPPIAYLYRRSVHDAVGPYDESMAVVADWEFNLRTVRRYDIAVLTKDLANWHFRDGGEGAADANVTRSNAWQYDEHKVRLFNRLLRDDLDAGVLGVGYFANLLQLLDRDESERDANVHLHLEHAIAQITDQAKNLADSTRPVITRANVVKGAQRVVRRGR